MTCSVDIHVSDPNERLIGGELKIGNANKNYDVGEEDDEEENITECPHSTKDHLQIALFYRDTAHSISSITQGRRMSLVFNIFENFKEKTEYFKDSLTKLDAFVKAIRGKGYDRLIHPLQHLYFPKGSLMSCDKTFLIAMTILGFSVEVKSLFRFGKKGAIYDGILKKYVDEKLYSNLWTLNGDFDEGERALRDAYGKDYKKKQQNS